MTDTNLTQLDISGLSSGVYIFKLTDKSESLMKKFVVNR